MQENTVTTYYNTGLFGWLELQLDHELLTKATFVDQPGKERTIPRNLKVAIAAYISKKSPLSATLYRFPNDATEFTKAVWQTIASIPIGKTLTYTDLARQAGRPNAARAAGSACGKNPLALFIPCHRIVRTQGEDFGYAWGADRKRVLLEHEGHTF